MNRSKVIGIAVAILIVGIAVGFGIDRTVTGRETKMSVSSGGTTKHAPTTAPSDEFDPFPEMQRMQEEIDRAIRRATEQFRFGSNAAWLSTDAGYSSSFDLRDRNDHFELRAYLPDAQAADVKVTTEGDRTVRVRVSHRAQQKNEQNGSDVTWSELGQSEQVVTLPEPVRVNEMKMDRKDHEVVITIPKANRS